jgi:hypothetical protein
MKDRFDIGDVVAVLNVSGDRYFVESREAVIVGCAPGRDNWRVRFPDGETCERHVDRHAQTYPHVYAAYLSQCLKLERRLTA